VTALGVVQVEGFCYAYGMLIQGAPLAGEELERAVVALRTLPVVC